VFLTNHPRTPLGATAIGVATQCIYYAADPYYGNATIPTSTRLYPAEFPVLARWAGIAGGSYTLPGSQEDRADGSPAMANRRPWQPPRRSDRRDPFGGNSGE
jgi:hypothetical protein